MLAQLRKSPKGARMMFDPVPEPDEDDNGDEDDSAST
jgi:hypothetical protein